MVYQPGLIQRVSTHFICPQRGVIERRNDLFRQFSDVEVVKYLSRAGMLKPLRETFAVCNSPPFLQQRLPEVLNIVRQG